MGDRKRQKEIIERHTAMNERWAEPDCSTMTADEINAYYASSKEAPPPPPVRDEDAWDEAAFNTYEKRYLGHLRAELSPADYAREIEFRREESKAAHAEFVKSLAEHRNDLRAQYGSPMSVCEPVPVSDAEFARLRSNLVEDEVTRRSMTEDLDRDVWVTEKFRAFRNSIGPRTATQGSFGWESLAPLPPKTSKSHPLRVDWFRPEVLGVAGALGMTFAPGKTNPRGVHGEHRRSMTEDLDRLAQRERADALVTLMEAPELHANKMDDLGPECRARGIEHLVLSIRDQSIPTDLHATIALVEDIADRLSAGKRVVVHCRGGHGRTGMIVACVLVALGYNADDAVTVTRATRSGTVHTDAQYDFVRLYQRWLEVDDTEEEAEFNV